MHKVLPGGRVIAAKESALELERRLESGQGKPPMVWVKSYKPVAMERKNDPATKTTKRLPHLVKDISGRTVVGICSVFGNLDSYDDISMPGSFAKTIRERGPKVYHLWQHDTTQPAIAVVEYLKEVGRDALPRQIRDAFPDALGGLEVARTYLEKGLAEWVFDGISKGIPYEMSYMYDALAYEYVEREDLGRTVRLLYEQRLWETSDVLWGANSAAVASKASDLLRIPKVAARVPAGPIQPHATQVAARGTPPAKVRPRQPVNLAAEKARLAALAAPLPLEAEKTRLAALLEPLSDGSSPN